MSLKIKRLRLASFQQFQDATLDFTDPEGHAAGRICLIGANGTGKSTILRLLDALVRGETLTGVGDIRAAAEVESAAGSAWVATTPKPAGHKWLVHGPDTPFESATGEGASGTRLTSSDLKLAQGEDLVVSCPAETSVNPGMSLRGPPRASLDAALGTVRDDSRRLRVEVSNATIESMWTELIAATQRRKQAREDYENRPENLQRTKAELIRSFDAEHPDPLVGLATLWNRILEPAGLFFDAPGARLPVQLSDNLDAHVRLRSTGEALPYGQLSTGTRHFLFRIGHLYLLFFGRVIRRGFVFVDEPENSLFPDFLFTLMEVYEEILAPHPSVQLFVATHNPIVAAQFHPHERVVLEWHDGFVTARKGSAPKGDDPNDLLRKDFGLPQLMGPEGRKQWGEYQRLRRAVRLTDDPAQKGPLLEQAAKIGRDYGFDP